MSLRGKTAIVGMGETEVGAVSQLSCTQLYAKAIKLAVADAGLQMQDIDGIITGNSRPEPYLYHAEMIAEYLQIHPTYCLSVNTGGGTTVAVMHHAATAIASRICNNVVIVMADNLISGMGRDEAVASLATVGHPQFEYPYGPSIPSLYALIAHRYMHEYGVTSEQFAVVSVTDRYHASLHPGAQFRKPITVDDVLNSKMISYPLHLLDCAPISDGGCAIVMTSAEHARALRQEPVYFLGVGEAHPYEHVSQAVHLTRTGAEESGRRAYAMAGLGPKNIDVAMIYDAFSFLTCIQIEDLGFCAKGEGGVFVAAGETRLGGRLPVNTHGGLLSHSHAGRPSSLFLVTEAVQQLRGQCQDRQVPGARTALVHAEGGILSSHATAILGKEV